MKWKGNIDGRTIEAYQCVRDTEVILEDHESLKVIRIPLPFSSFYDKWYDWKHKQVLIQKAFPDLTLDQREFIMSGSAFDDLLGAEEG